MPQCRCDLRFLGLALLALALLGCSPGQSDHGAEVLHRGLSGEPYEVMDDLYEGLTTESPVGEVIPGVASGWTVSASGTQYSFQLRTDAQWSNGKAVRAQDFIAAWQRVLDPKRGSAVADNLRLILNAPAIIVGKAAVSTLGVEARGDSVLIVTLERPAPYFPQVLSHSAASHLLRCQREQPRSCYLGVERPLPARSLVTRHGGHPREESPLLEPSIGPHTARRIRRGDRWQRAIHTLSGRHPRSHR
jgi:ABC-type oligopeptide transport system substrate-binding subunit